MTKEQPDKRPFKLEHTAGVVVSNDQIVEDMRRVASQFGSGSLSARLYRLTGEILAYNPSERFGSWNAALRAARLKVLNEVDLRDEELFKNIEKVGSLSAGSLGSANWLDPCLVTPNVRTRGGSAPGGELWRRSSNGQRMQLTEALKRQT